MNLDNGLIGVSSSPETKGLVAALVKAQRGYKAVKKSARNDFKGFKYPTFKDMCDAMLPSLLEQGLVPTFQKGFIPSMGWVMVGTLRHTGGEWISSVCPMRDQFDKQGQRVEDNQSMEAAVTYAKKILFMELAGGWLEGDEPEVQDDQVKAEVAEFRRATEGPKPAAAKPAGEGNYYKTLEARMKAVRQMPEQLEKYFRDAEKLAEEGDLTADHLARLTRQFGALRPKKEVANADAG